MRIPQGFIVTSLIIFSAVGFSLLRAPQAQALTGSSLTHCGTAIGTGVITFPGSTKKAYGPYYRTQYPGNNNSCVADIQRSLNATFCNSSSKLTVNGSYNAATKHAVTGLQYIFNYIGYKVNGSSVKVDGITGPQTFTILSTQQMAGMPNFTC